MKHSAFRSQECPQLPSPHLCHFFLGLTFQKHRMIFIFFLKKKKRGEKKLSARGFTGQKPGVGNFLGRRSLHPIANYLLPLSLLEKLFFYYFFLSPEVFIWSDQPAGWIPAWFFPAVGTAEGRELPGGSRWPRGCRAHGPILLPEMLHPHSRCYPRDLGLIFLGF